jgi:hypothetical protein
MGIESMSGYSLADVRVHYNSSRPAQLRAHAYAQGTDIHVAPGQEKHVPHEAWHLVQQAQGRVQPTLQTENGVAINDDAALEAEADRMGAQALQHSGASADTGASRRLARSVAPVQRRMLINGVEQIDAPATFGALDIASRLPENGDVLPLWQAANQAQQTIARMISTGNVRAYKSIAWEALYKVYGRQRTVPYRYTNDRQAIRGVVGETHRATAERAEGNLATDVLNSDFVTTNLRSAAQKIAAAIAAWKAGSLSNPPGVTQAVSPTLGDEPQNYKHYYSYLSPVESLLRRAGKQTTPVSVLNRAQGSTQGPLIASIHDLTDHLYADNRANGWQGTVNVPNARQVAHYRDAGDNIRTEPISTVRPNRQPINEESEVMKQTRNEGMAVDVGPSYTTGRMLMLAESVNKAYNTDAKHNRWDLKITDGEMTAVALALFAFWNKTYWEATSGIHKYKFVIDMLSNFVPGADSTRYPADLATFLEQTKAETERLNRTWEPPVEVVVAP